MTTQPLQIVPVHTKAQRMQFIKFPWRVYRGQHRDPNWVPPLISERKSFFDPEHGPFYQHADVQLFLAQRGAEIVGIISAHINHLHNEVNNEHIGFWGFFEVLDDPEAAQALLNAAAEWVRRRGYHAIRGPMNFSVNDECGLLIEGFDSPPVAMMTYNPPRYIDYVERAGFEKIMDLYAWIVSYHDYITSRTTRQREKLERVVQLVRSKSNITFRQFNMKDFDAEVERGWLVYNQAWADNWGAVPMTREEFDHLAYGFKPFLDPRIMLMAESEGKLVGLIIAVPDVNVPLRQMNGRLLPFGWVKYLWYKRKINLMRVMIMGVLPRYRRRGIDAVLYQDIAEAGARYGYPNAEMSWILETNDVMNHTLETLGSRRYKTYRVYEKPLVADYTVPNPRESHQRFPT